MATKMGMADLQLVDREGEDTQRVAVLDAPYRLSVRNALIPEPKADEVRVKILWVGICGSDLEAYRGTRAHIAQQSIASTTPSPSSRQGMTTSKPSGKSRPTNSMVRESLSGRR